MSLPAPRLLDAALRAQRTRPEDYVYHLTLHREGRPPASGERLASVGWAADELVALGRREQAKVGIVSRDDRDCLTVGLRALRRALDAEARRWRRLTMAAGYVEGWAVGIVAERGYRRSVFPGVGLDAMAGARVALTVPGGKTP